MTVALLVLSLWYIVIVISYRCVVRCRRIMDCLARLTKKKQDQEALIT